MGQAMTPTYESPCGAVRLFHARCEDVLPSLGGVDNCLTDPPYDSFTHSGAVIDTVNEQSLKQLGRKPRFSISVGEIDMAVMQQIVELPHRWSLCFCSLEMLGRYQQLQNDVVRYVRGGLWDRIRNTPQVSGDRPAQGGEGIAILHRRGGRLRWNGNGKAGIWRHLVESGNKQHPAQKPLSLLLDLVQQFTEFGETIFDPMMGSGTTGIACLRTGRKFIGIECCSDYFEIAKQRIIAELPENRMPLFEKPAPRQQTIFAE